ncbi:lipocalin family protein [Zobellia alginiliquefaciens]|uniref:lipocalin family protein n=1 Tax=Zobellia alginiliquefaciens TaxID=3032586 RepID=UPI0023E36E99|nr:lipocalin family protein [Zobellia alginiliquefaciens]
MKRSFILFSAIALGLFSSCSDDDSSDSPEDALLGSWQITAELENGDPYELDKCDLEETIIFRSDGVFEFFDYDPAEDNENECVLDDSSLGEWSSLADGKLTVVEDNSKSYTVDYSISGSTLMITDVEEYGDEIVVYETFYTRK